MESYPNTEAKAHLQASGNVALYNQLIALGKACIAPGFRFYQQKFNGEIHKTVSAFRAARLCCPVKVQELHPTAASVEELKLFFFLNNDPISELVHELPRYLAIDDGLKVQWWSAIKERALAIWRMMTLFAYLHAWAGLFESRLT